MHTFKDFISGEIQSADASLPNDIKNYLRDLLSFYLVTERLFEYKKDEGCYYEETLTELCLKLEEAQANKKIYILKKMGDISLYTTGFFRSSIERKIVDLSYYETVGQRAYGKLSYFYKEENIFRKLSHEFKNLSAILFYIQRKLGLQKDQNYIDLYGEYLETKQNSILKRILKEENLSPDETENK